ncbi:MAG: nicotinate-nucleotide--dimethylbenzimidazole phosphoribosyltransferase [Cellvibrionaceae bacterium]
MTQWFEKAVQPIDTAAAQAAKIHQSTLTKPLGSLGRLELIAEQFAAWQGDLEPVLDNINIAVFAGDHGVCQQGVSAFPQAVTTQMVTNFLDGGAAISVLSRELKANLHVVNMGIASALPEKYQQHQQLVNNPIAPGTKDFSIDAAMTQEQLELALSAGQAYVGSLKNTHLFIGGEMGIGNTTAASAIYAALLSLSPQIVVGPGTGVDEKGLARKQDVIERALTLHGQYLGNPYDVLRCVGGFEIAGLVGAYIACAQTGIPVLIDGFICTAAALIATRLNSGVRDWLLFSHQSAEPAHCVALKELAVTPLLQLDMRLGEGSGAAVATSIIKSALVLHNQMATFEQAGVSVSDNK